MPFRVYNMRVSEFSVFAAEVVAAAGGVARRRFLGRTLKIERKDNGEKVTNADRDIETFIREKIREKYPTHGFLGEESGSDGDMSCCWVADPIDGTTNFIHQYMNCGVSLAFCQNHKTQAAAIHDIGANETFSAARGEGAFADARRLRVSAPANVGESLFIAGGSMDGGLWPLARTLMRQSDGMRRSGSTVLDMASVAAGRMDMLVCGAARYWDVAAGALLIREAGGLLLDAEKRSSFVFGETTAAFIAGAPSVFSHYASVFQKHYERRAS